MTRRKQVGDLGEQWTTSLLEEAGFRHVQDLNAIRYNHRGGDFLAERAGTKYFITVKARNKYVQGTRQLNGGYNIFPHKVRAAAREYDSVPAWLAIQLDTDTRCFSAYFGTLDCLPNPNAVAVPMSVRAVAGYECLARDKFDQAITQSLSNQLAEENFTVQAEEPGRTRRKPASERSIMEKARSIQRVHSRSATSGRGTLHMASFDDHVAYADPAVRPVLLALRARILALGNNIEENMTPAQRITYRVARIFAELKVQKKLILVRFFDMPIHDPKNLVRRIEHAKKNNWQHDREIRIDSLELVEYAMRFVSASYRSLVTTRVIAPFGRG